MLKLITVIMKLLPFPFQQNVSDAPDSEDIDLVVFCISAAPHEGVSSLHITKFTHSQNIFLF